MSPLNIIVFQYINNEYEKSVVEILVWFCHTDLAILLWQFQKGYKLVYYC